MTEREQFEAEYRKRSDRDDDDVEESLRLGKDGEYLYGNTWTAFYWWQAARAASPKVPQGVEEWIAEHGLQYVDTLGGYGVKLKRSSELKYPCPEYVSVDDLSELLSGMAIVPVVGKDSFVQLVPDHCDRIVWRGSYHHLPLAATKEKGE